MRVCNKCKVEKDDILFSKNQNKCKECDKAYRDSHKEETKEYAKKYQPTYYIENKTYIIERNEKYRDIHIEEHRQNQRLYEAERRKTDHVFRSRKNVGVSIWQFLKSQKISKNGDSYLSYLPWTWKEYEDHMEQLFKKTGNEWMNWNNQGKYIKSSWNDHDSNTWTWQLDHIIPQSDFLYTSMEDENFKKCWALDNLRPLSAKQNLLDGVNRFRHKNKF